MTQALKEKKKIPTCPPKVIVSFRARQGGREKV